MHEEIYDLKSAGFHYGNEDWILKNITFKIHRGDRIALLGANGSGKSTLLKMLDGLLFPVSGDITAFGVSLNEKNFTTDFQYNFRKKVGFVFEEPDSQLFCATVEEEIRFGLTQLSFTSTEINERAAYWLDKFGITQLRNKAPFHLSSGEKRKVIFAAISAANPEILLLDEPTNHLDPKSQVWITEYIQALPENLTIVLATHDLSIVEDLAQRIILINENHTILADDIPLHILYNEKLLLEANLIHKHSHKHKFFTHIHSHGHAEDHSHYHPNNDE